MEAARPETYAELAARVRQLRREQGLRDCRTEESNETVWILPEVGPLPVADIRPDHIGGIYETARKAGKSLSHLRHLRMVLRSRFAFALEEETIVRSPSIGLDCLRLQLTAVNAQCLRTLSWPSI